MDNAACPASPLAPDQFSFPSRRRRPQLEQSVWLEPGKLSCRSSPPERRVLQHRHAFMPQHFLIREANELVWAMSAETVRPADGGVLPSMLGEPPSCSYTVSSTAFHLPLWLLWHTFPLSHLGPDIKKLLDVRRLTNETPTAPWSFMVRSTSPVSYNYAIHHHQYNTTASERVWNPGQLHTTCEADGIIYFLKQVARGPAVSA